MAVRPTRLTKVIMVPRTMPGMLSRSSTRQMMAQVPMPMDWAASISPLSTSASAASTCRVKKGTVPKTRGTMAPAVPMAVPAISRVRGISAASRMMKGMERKVLMIRSSTTNSPRLGLMPPGLAMDSTTPNKRPMAKEISPDTPIMNRVCQMASRNSSDFLIRFGMMPVRNSSTLDHLHVHLLRLQVLHGLFQVLLLAGGNHDHPAQGG